VVPATLEQNRSSGKEPAVATTAGNLVKRIRRLLYPRSERRLDSVGCGRDPASDLFFSLRSVTRACSGNFRPAADGPGRDLCL
jgi:hypothetical protein